MYAKIKLYIFCISCLMSMIVVEAAADKGKEQASVEQAALLGSLGKANSNFREEKSLEEMKCDTDDKGKDPAERAKEKMAKRKTSILLSVIYNDSEMQSCDNPDKVAERLQVLDKTAENLLSLNSKTRKVIILAGSGADSPRHDSPRYDSPRAKDDSCIPDFFSHNFNKSGSSLRESIRRNSCSNEQIMFKEENV